MKLKHSFSNMIMIACFIGMIVTSPSLCWGQDGSTSGLSSEAEKYLQRGMSALNMEEWELAVRYFNDLLDESPRYPLAYYNLALAHNKLGHNLTAISWFKAFLAAQPDSPRREQIEKAILNSDVAVEAQVEKIFSQATELAAALPDEYDRRSALWNLLDKKARMGDLKWVREKANQYKDFVTYSDAEAQAAWADHSAYYGNEAEAMKYFDGLTQEQQEKVIRSLISHCLSEEDLEKGFSLVKKLAHPENSYEVTYLAHAFARKGLWNEAVVLAEKMADPKKRSETYRTLGMRAFYDNDLAKAQEMLDKTKKMIDGTDSSAVAYLAQAYLDIGAPEEAKQLIEKFPVVKNYSYQYYTAFYAGIYAQLGEVKKGEGYFSEMENADQKSTFAGYFIRGATANGDWKKAQKYLSYLEYSPFHPTAIGQAYGQIIQAMINDGKESQAMKLMNEIPNNNENNFNQVNIAKRDLCINAVRAGNDDKVNEYLKGPWNWEEYCVSAAAKDKIKKGNLEDAWNILKENVDLKYHNADINLLEYWLQIAQGLAKQGNNVQAVEVLDNAIDQAIAWKDSKMLITIADAYEKYLDPAYLDQVKEWIKPLPWVALARNLEEKRTADLEAAYKDIQSKEARDIPSAMASLGDELHWALEKTRKEN